MKVLRNWLLELCDLDAAPSADELARALTSVGLEVEGQTDLGAGFTGVVVAEVVAVKPHPSADKLRLVDVITSRGGAATQVVCGAPNVPAPGGRVLWAQPGATLPGGLTLAVRAVKGVDSPGMLCAEAEGGVGDAAAGIVVLEADDRTPLGAPAQQALGVDDWLLEVNAPANRPDVLGHVGVARELVARLGGRLVAPDGDLAAHTLDGPALGERLAVAIDDAAGCARYVARRLEGVTVGPSPRWLRQRLRGVGVRPISNLVDVTNYVMFELGQPLHAFDAERLLDRRIAVRTARTGETLATLDGVRRSLATTDLVIVDGAEAQRAVALAGVMGGAETEVHAGTTSIVLESASFAPRRVRATARRLGLHSESSLRFERGVDPALAEQASARAARLLAVHGGGRVVAGAVDVYPAPAAKVTVALRPARLAAVTGVGFDDGVAADALARLGCEVVVDGDALRTTVPSWRGDLSREADLIEEVLRITGYDRVPSTLPPLRAANPLFDTARAGGDETPIDADGARRILAAAGLAEAITFGFQSFARHGALNLAPTDRRSRPIALRNPMSSDQAIMRTSLVPNLLAAVARNHSHGEPDLALFEVGPVFLRRDAQGSEVAPRELADEEIWACAVLVGARPRHLGAPTAWDVFDAKGLLEQLACARARGPHGGRWTATRDVPYLHPGVAAELRFGDAEPAGWIGEIHPDVRAAFGIDVPVFAFDVRLRGLPVGGAPQMAAIPRFPRATRDVSLLLDVGIPAARVDEVIAGERPALLEAARVVEDYRDPKLPAGTKSVLWTLSYRAGDRTLTDAEVDAAHEALVSRLVAEVPAQRR
ncbi:MAG: phenylalanine--tRNA ligase subunit beta [Kofleriaceae bacterium]